MPTASERFFQTWERLAKAEARIGEVLAQRSAKWLAMPNVVGFGVGRKGSHLAALFFVSGKVPAASLPVRHRLPQSIKVDGAAIPVDVVLLGPVRLTGPVGDPRENRTNHRVEGVGEWQMGSAISARLPNVTSQGTAGALVRTAGGEVMMLSCSHVLLAQGAEVAQHERYREFPPSTALHNSVGQVVRVAPWDQADAGYAEVAGARPAVLHIGAPRPPAPGLTPTIGLYVQKSGRATGLTYSRILVTNATISVAAFPAPLNGLTMILNTCAEAADPALLGNPDLVGRFSAPGDSGSLVMYGNPARPEQFGEPQLQQLYDNANATEKRRIRDGFERVALGLLCAEASQHIDLTLTAGTPPYTFNTLVSYAQDINLALNTLQVTLVT